MSLLDAPPYDSRREKRRTITTIAVIVLVLLAVSGYLYWPRFMARRTVSHFMQELVKKNYQEAYYIWQADPKLYSMDAFMRDWGPGSRWGIIKTYQIEQLGPPPGGHSSGLVAVVEINGIASREEPIWIENRTRELSFGPVLSE